MKAITHPSRRAFLKAAVVTTAAAGSGARVFGATSPQLEAGEGVVDTTPPLKIELGGFHRPPGQERRIEGIRQRTAARALVLRVGDTTAAIVSLDVIIVPEDFCQRVAKRVESATGIPAANVRICATHTHSMPSFAPLRQWGAVPDAYMATVEDAIVEAIRRGRQDLAPAELHLGAAAASGANFNRTIGEWKTDAQFDPATATDEQRWLDTRVHALRFVRGGTEKKSDLIWYHFSAHPVCYTDGQAGPDWPGMVANRIHESHGVMPSFLQGHCGDVNPGDGTPWIGDPEKTATGVTKALREALDNAKRIKVDALRLWTSRCEVPIDNAELKDEIERYRAHPEECNAGEWVDAGFAKDWFDAASKWDLKRDALKVPVSTLRLGELGWLFHPSELFSYYGLRLRRTAPTPHTLIVGYTDDAIGYLSDPPGYKARIYEAAVVPKILNLPPFTPTAARVFTDQLSELMKKRLT